MAPIDFRGDFETSDTSQFTAVECPNPERQLEIVTNVVRQGRYAARFEVSPKDKWSNGSIRCLVANTDTKEREDDDYYFAFSIYFPRCPAIIYSGNCTAGAKSTRSTLTRPSARTQWSAMEAA